MCLNNGGINMGCKPKKSVCKNKEGNYVKTSKASTPRARNNTLFFVHLRRESSPQVPKADPKYDTGSFGTTGCHKSNLLNPKKVLERIGKGDRFVFLQGGKDEKKGYSTIKISFITPPIKDVKISKGCGVIKWDSNWDEHHKRPLNYKYQFNLLEKPENTLFTKNEKKILKIMNPNILMANKPTKAAKISSCMKTRCKEGLSLNSEGAEKIITAYSDNINKMRRNYRNKIFIRKNREAY